jgi:hypothetical protein
MSIVRATLDLISSRRHRIFEKYSEAAPSPSVSVEEKLRFHTSRLIEYASMYSEAAFVARKQSLSFAVLRDNDVFLLMEAAATNLRKVENTSEWFSKNLPEAGRLLESILNSIEAIKSGRKSSTTTPRTLDLLFLAAASLNQVLDVQLLRITTASEVQCPQLPKRLLETAVQLGLPLFQKQQPLAGQLDKLVAVLAADTVEMIGEDQV